MQTAQLKLREILDAEGKVLPSAQPLLCDLVERYPFYHAARMLLLRLLYQQRDPQFNEELRKAALYLPSRAKIYQEIERDSMRPSPEKEKSFTGATHARKSKSPVEIAHKGSRTEELLGTFLDQTPPVLWDSKSGRPVDATTDYMGYLAYQETMEQQVAPAVEEVKAKDVENETPTDGSENLTSPDRIGLFIQNQGDKRIKLSDKQDSELRKPTLPDNDSGAQQSTFTETMARIYIKQGKFERAIEIIRRLSLKYPKKNRYFADQIRFLEKLIINNQAK